MKTTLSDRLTHLMDIHKMSAADLARAAGVTRTSVSLWLSGSTKSLRGDAAAKLAKTLRVDPFWLATGEVIPTEVADSGRDDGRVLIPQYDAAGAMGSGLELRDQPGLIHNWTVSQEWLQRNVRSYTSRNNLCIVTGFGDSMRPMLNPGDPLLVDLGITSVDYDAVYFFRVGNEGFIKRLQRIPVANKLVIRARSENAQYEPWDITTDMDFQVFGRILKVWCSTDF